MSSDERKGSPYGPAEETPVAEDYPGNSSADAKGYDGAGSHHTPPAMGAPEPTSGYPEGQHSPPVSTRPEPVAQYQEESPAYQGAPQQGSSQQSSSQQGSPYQDSSYSVSPEYSGDSFSSEPLDYNSTAPHGSVTEIFGSAENIEKLGSPIISAEQNVPIRYVFYPTWRSQTVNLILFFVLSILAIWGSQAIETTVIAGRLFRLGSTEFYLHLPLLSLMPGFMLGKILINIYDAKYIIDSRGVEAQIGLVSMSLRQPRLRWEDIRGVEPNQTIWERVLGIGSVLIGSAMTQDVEIVMEGVSNPRAIQLLIGGERDRRLDTLRAENGDIVEQRQVDNAILGD